MKLRKTKVIGKRTVTALCPPGKQFEQNTYAPNADGQLFERLRHCLCIPISAAAKAVGLDPVDFYGLRQGRLAFRDHADFLKAVDLLVGVVEERTKGALDRLLADIHAGTEKKR